MHPHTPWGWILQWLVRADAEPLVRERGTSGSTAVGFAPSFTSMLLLTSCQTKRVTAGLNLYSFTWWKFQEQLFLVENQNCCILKGWSFAGKLSRCFRNSLVSLIAPCFM